MVAALPGGEPAEDTQIGRFILLCDVDERMHPVAAGTNSAICETDPGMLLMLPADRTVHVPRLMVLILAWLDGRG